MLGQKTIGAGFERSPVRMIFALDHIVLHHTKVGMGFDPPRRRQSDQHRFRPTLRLFPKQFYLASAGKLLQLSPRSKQQ